MEYQVDLETFRGPLDLLLYLVKRDEVDIRDIPISRVTDQYLAYLRLIEMIDVEWAGEFLVMAATLMEIKSRMLLPQAASSETPEDDPRLELVRQLIEYKRFKDAAALLDASAERQQSRLARVPAPPAPGSGTELQPLRAVELWDLVSAFGRLMRETLALQPRQIVMDETPIHVYMANLLALLRASPRLALSDAFTPPRTRGRLLGLFLAILELIKGRKIVVEQPEAFGDIVLSIRASEPADPASQSSTP